MRRILYLATAVSLAVLLPLAAHPTLADSTWVNTQTQAEAPVLVSATSIGALDGSTPLHLTIALQVQNQTALNQYIQDINTPGNALYGQTLDPATFAADYAPTPSQVQAVESYLSSMGMTNIQADSNNLTVTADATAAQAESAFNTQIGQFSQNGTTIYANLSTAQVPTSLNGVVAAVLGLTNAAKMATPPVPNATSYLSSYNPQGFQKAYDATSTATGGNTSVAIFAEGDLSGTITDLRAEETANSLPQVPVTVVQSGIASPDTSGADEWDMDTQYSTGMAQTVNHLYLYDATSLTDSDLAVSFSKFVSQNYAKAGSASFGECEYQAYLDGSMVADDQYFAEAAAQGQTVFASAGDTGGFCPVAPTNGAPAGVPDVNYPASSPYVVSVGGTSLFTNSDGTYQDEIAWAAGGGGPSEFEYQPYWQNGVTPATSTSCVQVVACLGKNLPDIAMDADPNTGANVYIGGTPTVVGGTSLASPLALGVWARLESSHGNTLGFAAPQLYAPTASVGLHDIVEGDTGPYPATPGWDYATGLGSFDVAAMVSAIIPPSPVTPQLAYPACTTTTDPYGDAHPLASTGNVDSLDIRAVGFSPDSSNVTAKMMVQSLNDGPGGTPMLAGDGDVWYITWTYNGTVDFLSAEFPGSSADPSNPLVAVTYSYGNITKSPTGGTLYNTNGSATGSFDLTNSVITLSAPLTAFSIPAGSALTSTGGSTFESVGSPAGGLLEAADTAGPGSSYTLGTSCSAATPTPTDTPTSTPTDTPTPTSTPTDTPTPTNTPTSTPTPTPTPTQTKGHGKGH